MQECLFRDSGHLGRDGLTSVLGPELGSWNVVEHLDDRAWVNQATQRGSPSFASALAE
jgi:hypothetical protein